MATSPTEREAPGGWVDLRATDDAGAIGCLLGLAAILLIAGGGILAVFLVSPASQGQAWVMPVVGAAFFLVGGLLLYGGIRGARGRSIAPAELSIQGGMPLRPGTPVGMRIRQPGPVALESLLVTVTCRREYRRKVRPNSSSTVPDHEVLWEQVLLAIADEVVPSGGVLEREVPLVLPARVSATGPALPDGHVRWRIEVAAEAGFIRARHRAFDVRVEGAAAAVPGAANEWSAIFEPGAAEEAATAAEPTPRASTPPRARRPGKGLSFNAGCLVIAVPFVACGGFFLWAFFSGAAFRGRGNPYMALFGGLLFAGAGLLGVAGVALSSTGSRKPKRKR